MKSKLCSLAHIRRLAETLRQRGKRIVFTNGCFDVLHVGHVAYLTKARHSGDVLIVGLNSDRSVRTIKGPSRPINDEIARALVLSALEAVDHVVLFEEPTPLRLIEVIKPHVLAKGADWPAEKIAGSKEIKAWGGRLKRIPLVEGYSTTRILKQCCK